MYAHARRTGRLSWLGRSFLAGLVAACVFLACSPDAFAQDRVDPPAGPGGQEGEGPWYNYGRIELTPYVSSFFYSGNITPTQFGGDGIPDMDPGGAMGIRLGAEVPGLVATHFEFGYSRGNTKDVRRDFWGDVYKFGFYIGLQNPELSVQVEDEDGGMRYALTTTAGVGLTGFSRVNFERQSDGRTLNDAHHVAFTPWFEIDFHLNENIRLGLGQKVHLVFATELEGDDEDFLQHDAVVFEPQLSLSFLF